MRITSRNLQYFNEHGVKHIKSCIATGSKKQYELNGGENGDFDAMCEVGMQAEHFTHRQLISFLDELEEFDKDDGFGTEGWEHCFGLGD